MKSVNMATQLVIDMFRSRCDELPFDEHPYNAVLIAKNKLKKGDEFIEENRDAAIAALALWVMQIVGSSVTNTLNEILAVMRIANDGDDEAKKAAKEMAGSMPFLEKISTVFLNEVEMAAVAEWLLEDGQRRENALKEKSAEDTKKAPIQNWTSARWNPSLN